MIRLRADEALKIVRRKGLDTGDDGVTFYAYDEKNDEVYTFDTKRERDAFVTKAQRKEQVKVW
jgi:hypothetical protein